MIKLIITDMDGTLLNDAHQVPANFWEIEEQLHQRGIMLSVASGRQFYNLESKFEKIKDRMLFFAENGTLVVHKGKELYVNPLDKKAAMEFIKIGRQLQDTYVVLCGKNSAYIESKDPGFFDEIKNYYERVEIVDNIAEVEDIFLKVTLAHFEGVQEHTYPHFEKFKDEYKVAVAARIFLDITSLQANKGNAIKGVQKELNISPEETLVFGDYLNDLEMMQTAKYSYAMKNAHPEIIAISNYVTKYGNNDNGVLRTIEGLGLLKEN